MVAQLAPAQLRGSAFGLLGLTQAFGDLGSTAVVGVLWAAVSPMLGFAYAAAWMLIAVVAATAIAHRRGVPSASDASSSADDEGC
jgi:hypothetical protein